VLIARRKNRTGAGQEISSELSSEVGGPNFTPAETQPSNTSNTQVNARFKEAKTAIKSVKADFQLNAEQSRCYSFVAHNLLSILFPEIEHQILSGLCMYLGGPGGTGKSKVIKAIATLFQKLNCRDMLYLTAPVSLQIPFKRVQLIIYVGFAPVIGKARTESMTKRKAMSLSVLTTIGVIAGF
jgi:ABC-type uncharacterized transport system fused permease/ATPase subunit